MNENLIISANLWLSQSHPVLLKFDHLFENKQYYQVLNPYVSVRLNEVHEFRMLSTKDD